MKRRRPAATAFDAPEMSAVAAAIGEPARARMLAALLGGRALTATELALEADVAPSTASHHLERLAAAGLVARVRQGRHRYFRLAGERVGALLERLMVVAAELRTSPGPRDPALRRARVCYDHLAGERGVALLAAMRAHGLVRDVDGALALTPAGRRWLGALGVDVAALARARRPLVRACVDWSERRDHLGGAVGAALLSRLLALGWVAREPVGRALSLSARGEAFVDALSLPAAPARGDAGAPRRRSR